MFVLLQAVCGRATGKPMQNVRVDTVCRFVPSLLSSYLVVFCASTNIDSVKCNIAVGDAYVLSKPYINLRVLSSLQQPVPESNHWTRNLLKRDWSNFSILLKIFNSLTWWKKKWNTCGVKIGYHGNINCIFYFLWRLVTLQQLDSFFLMSRGLMAAWLCKWRS